MKLITKDYKQFEIGNGETTISVQFSSLDRVLPGDEVVSGGNNKWISCKRDKHPPLVGTIDLINKTRYGFTARNVPVYLFHPMNKAYPPFRVGSSIDPKNDSNYLAVVQFESWELGAGTPRGIVTEVLGPVGNENAEHEALYWLYSPWSQYTKKTSVFEIVKDNTKRLDLTSDEWNTFNVDPVGCRDIDDVFSYMSCGDGGIQCVITIADVAAILPANSPIDEIARRIGQSLYCDGRKPRHMLPQSIAEGHGSLLEGETRYGISLFFYLSKDNQVKEPHFEHTLIKCHKSYTYENFITSPHAPILKLLCSAMTPAVDNSDSHNWIAALMIYYNIEFAKVLANGREGVVGLLRSHSGPDMLRFKQLEAIDSDLTFFAQSSAKYIPANLPLTEVSHYGLKTSTYTHATSPLRRYADLYNQRIFKILLGLHELHQPLTFIENIDKSLNERAKAAKKHDRDSFWLHQLLLSDHKSGNIQAVIIGIKQKSDIIVAEVYCKEWKRIIKLRLTGTLIDNGSMAQVKSRDEKNEFVIGEKDIINIACSFDMNRPHWTDRIVFQLLKVYSLRGIPPTVPECQ